MYDEYLKKLDEAGKIRNLKERSISCYHNYVTSMYPSTFFLRKSTTVSASFSLGKKYKLKQRSFLHEWADIYVNDSISLLYKIISRNNIFGIIILYGFQRSVFSVLCFLAA